MPEKPALMADLQMEKNAGLHGAKYEVGSLKDGKQLGVVRIVGNGLKATCRRHAQCVCWVNIAPNKRINLLASLMRWLAEGPGLSEDAHYLSCVALKVSFGVKVRR